MLLCCIKTLEFWTTFLHIWHPSFSKFFLRAAAAAAFLRAHWTFTWSLTSGWTKDFLGKKSPANCCSDFHFVQHKCSRLSQKMHYYSPENSTHLFFKSMNRTFWMHLNFKAHLWVDWWCSRDLDVTSVSNGQSSWNIKTLLGWQRGLRLAYALTDNTKNAGNPILFQSIWGAV